MRCTCSIKMGIQFSLLSCTHCFFSSCIFALMVLLIRPITSGYSDGGLAQSAFICLLAACAGLACMQPIARPDSQCVDILWLEVQWVTFWWHVQLLHVLHVHSLRLAHHCCAFEFVYSYSSIRLFVYSKNALSVGNKYQWYVGVRASCNNLRRILVG